MFFRVNGQFFPSQSELDAILHDFSGRESYHFFSRHFASLDLTLRPRRALDLLLMRNELEKRIKKQVSEIALIEKEIAALESKKSGHRQVISELESLIRIIPKTAADTESVQKQLRFGSDVYLAREVLQSERKPLYIKDLLEKMGVEPTRNRRSSLSSQLATYANKEEIFTKTGPNIFGLIDYGPVPVTAEDERLFEAHQEEDEPEEEVAEPVPPPVPVNPTVANWMEDDDIPF